MLTGKTLLRLRLVWFAASLLVPTGAVGGSFCSGVAARFAHRRCAIAVPVARCAWIHRRGIRRARRHDGCAANILGCRHTLSAGRTEIAELLRLSDEVHCLYPASRFADIACATAAYLSDLI